MSFTGTFGLNRFLRTAKVHGMPLKDGNFVAQLIFILVIFIFYIFFPKASIVKRVSHVSTRVR